MQDWLEHTFRNSQPAKPGQPATNQPPGSQPVSPAFKHDMGMGHAVRPSKTMGLKNEANYCSNINFTPNNAFCSPCILQTFHIYSLSICGGHHHHHHHVGCHGTQQRPSEVEAMEAELESDKSGPVCIVNRYRHSKRQRMMEKQLDAESPTCSPAGDENEQKSPAHQFCCWQPWISGITYPYLSGL